MRRIVPDNSVIIAAFYPEVIQRDGKRLSLTERARPLLTAIGESWVEAFAPYSLVSEFMKVSRDKYSTRQGAGQITVKEADEALADFLTLPIEYVSEFALAQRAWDLIRQHNLPPTDAWFLACAMEKQADLWISHRQKDGFAQAARLVYDRVFLLTEDKFSV